jgi:hypothetical protein
VIVFSLLEKCSTFIRDLADLLLAEHVLKNAKMGAEYLKKLWRKNE